MAIRWPNACVVMATHATQPPPNLTPELVMAAARAAAAAWSRPGVACTGWELRVIEGPPGPAPMAANNNANDLMFSTGWAYEPSALAITTVFARQDSGTILDADLEVNASSRFKWGDLVARGPAAGVQDLQNTLTHEFGHLLGLDHNCFLFPAGRPTTDDQGKPVPDCATGPATLREATMYPAPPAGDFGARTLSDDDVAAVCAIYPAASAVTCDGADAGADASAGPGQDGGADTTIAAADTGAPATTSPDAAGPDTAVVTLPSTRGCDCTTGGRARLGGTPFSVVLCLARAFIRRRRV